MIEFAFLNVVVICTDVNVTYSERIWYCHNIIAGYLFLRDAVITIGNRDCCGASADEKSYFIRLALGDNNNTVFCTGTTETVDIAAENRCGAVSGNFINLFHCFVKL